MKRIRCLTLKKVVLTNAKPVVVASPGLIGECCTVPVRPNRYSIHLHLFLAFSAGAGTARRTGSLLHLGNKSTRTND